MDIVSSLKPNSRAKLPNGDFRLPSFHELITDEPGHYLLPVFNQHLHGVEMQSKKPSRFTSWSSKQDYILIDLRDNGMTWCDIGKRMRRSPGACQSRYQILEHQQPVINDTLHGIETQSVQWISQNQPNQPNQSKQPVQLDSIDELRSTKPIVEFKDSIEQKKGAEWVYNGLRKKVAQEGVEEKETREWLEVEKSEKTEVKVRYQLPPPQRQSRRKRSFVHDEDSLARLQGEKRTLDNTTQNLPVRCSLTSDHNGSQEYSITERGKIDKKGKRSIRIKREPTNSMIENLPRVENPNIETTIVYVKDVVPTIKEQRRLIFMG
jgi:hypothetical protein